MLKGIKMLFKAAVISLAALSVSPFLCACSEETEPEEPNHFNFGGDVLGLSPLTSPEIAVKSAVGMVCYTYTARDCGAMRLSLSPSFNSGISVEAKAGTATYSEVVFTQGNSMVTSCPYRYAKSYYRDADNILWASDTTSLYREGYAIGVCSGAYTSDELLTSYKAFRLDANEGDDVFISAAYKGECATYIDDENKESSQVVACSIKVTKKLGEEISVDVGGMTFYFRLRVGTIQMRASQRITLGDAITNFTDYGAVVVSVMEATDD